MSGKKFFPITANLKTHAYVYVFVLVCVNPYMYLLSESICLFFIYELLRRKSMWKRMAKLNSSALSAFKVISHLSNIFRIDTIEFQILVGESL